MTKLSLSARNLLAQDTAITALLGKSVSWDTWIFDENPLNVHVENNSKVLIVVSEGDPWAPANQDNTMSFPTLIVDIWADPSRNSNKSVRQFDAKDKIEAVKALVDQHFHLVDGARPGGQLHIWGTAAQIASKTGLVVTGSTRASGPIYSPIRDTDGAWMGRMTYNVNVP